jgi:hypothetical protein
MRASPWSAHLAIPFGLLVLAGCGAREPVASGGVAPVLAGVNAPEKARPRRVASIEACHLLSRGEVESIFGPLKTDPKSDVGLRGERVCRYQNQKGQWLKVSLYGSDRWELEKGIVTEQHPAPISALGDEAFAVRQGTDNLVYVRKGEGVIEISCSCVREKAQAIAIDAVTNL